MASNTLILPSTEAPPNTIEELVDGMSEPSNSPSSRGMDREIQPDTLTTALQITPSIIVAELATVKDWIPTQDTDTQALIIKVNPKGKEITAGYEIDDQTMQIAIRLPPTYPLHQATVEGIKRVGVDEKKWQSWLINTQGVITFSNGSLIDGLIAYRRNVVGAFKGQAECAICYSIISADRQLPNKRCGTCKNTFHSICLYKWFKSSNSASCPLCRNAFNYS